MNFSKIKKVVSAGVAAVMCVTMALSVPASAKTDSTAYKNTKALTSAKYNSNYIKLVDKYSAKKSSKTVSFSKSKTKKHYEKIAKARAGKNPQVCANIINKDMIISSAMKGDKVKVVMYIKIDKAELALAYYMDSKNITALSPTKKLMFTGPNDSSDQNSMASSMGGFDIDSYMSESIGIADNAKGKYFKFTSNKKTYYYEEFTKEDGKIVGFLFDSKGNPLAMTDGTVSYCFSVSFKVKDSEFTLPKGYKTADKDMDMSEFLF